MAFITVAQCCRPASSCMLSSTTAVQALRVGPYLVRRLTDRWIQTHSLPSRDVSCSYSRAQIAVGTGYSLNSWPSSSPTGICESQVAKTGRRRRRKLPSAARPAELPLSESELLSKSLFSHAKSAELQRLMAKIEASKRYSAIYDKYKKMVLRVRAPGVVVYNMADTADDCMSPFGVSWIKFVQLLLSFIEVPEDDLHADGLKCAVAGCNEPAVVGAHVAVPSGPGFRLPLIAPFCYKHNHCRKHPPSSPLALKEGACLVPIRPHPCWNVHCLLEEGGKWISQALSNLKSRNMLQALMQTVLLDGHTLAWMDRAGPRQHFVVAYSDMAAVSETCSTTVARSAKLGEGIWDHQHDVSGFSSSAGTRASAAETATESMALLSVMLALQLGQGPSVYRNAGLAFVNGNEAELAADWHQDALPTLLKPKLVKTRTLSG